MPIANRNLTEGTRLVATYKKEQRTCVAGLLKDGRMAFRSTTAATFTSPSAAGSAVMGGQACNGWRFWTIEGESPAKTPKAEKPKRTRKVDQFNAEMAAANAKADEAEGGQGAQVQAVRGGARGRLLVQRLHGALRLRGREARGLRQRPPRRRPRAGGRAGGGAVVTETRVPQTRMEYLIDWKLATDVEHTRQAIIRRARSLAERLTRVADGLEADPDYSFNTLGELQGNGVELDTWCAKLGQGRELLKLFRQAQEETSA